MLGKIFVTRSRGANSAACRDPKGKGYLPAERSTDKFHGVAKFNVVTGEQEAPVISPSYTKVFANALVAEAEVDLESWRLLPHAVRYRP